MTKFNWRSSSVGFDPKYINQGVVVNVGELHESCISNEFLGRATTKSYELSRNSHKNHEELTKSYLQVDVYSSVQTIMIWSSKIKNGLWLEAEIQSAMNRILSGNGSYRASDISLHLTLSSTKNQEPEKCKSHISYLSQ